MSFKGIVKVKRTIRYTDFPYPKRLIEGKELLLIKQNQNGDCTCLWGICGILTLELGDIEKVHFNKLIDPTKYINQYYTDSREFLSTHIQSITRGKL